MANEAYRGGFDGRSGWWLRFPFNHERIEALKTAVSYRDQVGVCRHWDEDGKRWWIAQEYVGQLQRVGFPWLEAFMAAIPLPGFEEMIYDGEHGHP